MRSCSSSFRSHARARSAIMLATLSWGRRFVNLAFGQSSLIGPFMHAQF